MRCPGPLGSCPPVCSAGVLRYVCAVLGHFAPVPRCARSVRCIACAVSWVTWLLFTGVPARCVVLCVRCPEPLRSCSPVCSLGALCCVCGVLRHLAPVHRCVPLVCCVVVGLSHDPNVGHVPSLSGVSIVRNVHGVDGLRAIGAVSEVLHNLGGVSHICNVVSAGSLSVLCTAGNVGCAGSAIGCVH